MNNVYESIEQCWKSRCEAGHFTPKQQKEKQQEFFTGAMAALHAMGVPDGQAMPPRWVVTIMSGDLVGAK